MTHRESLATAPRALALILATLIGAGLADGAAAAPLDSFAGRRAGTGTLEGAPGTAQLSEAEVRLRPGGAAEILVFDRRGSFRFTGSWRKDPGDYVKLEIVEAMGNPASASGWVLVRDGRFERIELDGRSQGGRKLALSFEASGRDLPYEPDWTGLDATESGWGELELTRARREVERARVVLSPDGRAEITVWAPGELRLSGSWSDRRADSVRIEIRQVSGATSAQGSGEVRWRRDGLESVELSGTLDRDPLRLGFRAGATPPRPPASGSFTIEYGHDQPGADYRDLSTPDIEACQDACARDERCRAYTFNTRDRRCYLKSEERPLVRRSDTVTGVKRSGSGSGGLTERPGYNLEGGDYSRVYLDKLDQCQEACRRDRQCLAYTYNTRDRMCYLKDRVGTYSRRSDTVSGEKESGYRQ